MYSDVPRSVPRWRLVVDMQKSVDVCICCRPTARGFLHCPIKVGRQRAEATLVYATATSTSVSRETSCRMARNHISTGIYRCSTLDFDMKFCEISGCQESARINAFHKMSADPPTLPVTGLLRCGLHGKVTHLFAFGKQIFMGDQLLIFEAVCFLTISQCIKQAGGGTRKGFRRRVMGG